MKRICSLLLIFAITILCGCSSGESNLAPEERKDVSYDISEKNDLSPEERKEIAYDTIIEFINKSEENTVNGYLDENNNDYEYSLSLLEGNGFMFVSEFDIGIIIYKDSYVSDILWFEYDNSVPCRGKIDAQNFDFQNPEVYELQYIDETQKNVYEPLLGMLNSKVAWTLSDFSFMLKGLNVNLEDFGFKNPEKLEPAKNYIRIEVENKCLEYSAVDEVENISYGTFETTWNDEKHNFITEVRGTYQPVDEYGESDEKMYFSMTFIGTEIDDYEISNEKIE